MTLKVVEIPTRMGEKRGWVKEGYDYALSDENAGCTCFCKAVKENSPKPFYCVCKEIYLNRKCDVFEQEQCTRNRQLEKNWPKRYPMPNQKEGNVGTYTGNTGGSSAQCLGPDGRDEQEA